MGERVAAIIVSHNSEPVLDRCLAALQAQSHPLAQIIIVDNGSTRLEYLAPFRGREGITLVEGENIGFARANNLALQFLSGPPDLLLFLNPDTFLRPETVAVACRCLRERPGCGLLSGKLLRYDLKNDQATGVLDTTGVFRKWYGRWYDRGQGERDQGRFDRPETVPALCGALLFCRGALIGELGGRIFDPDFFLYKEDIELSLRVRQAGRQCSYCPEVVAYHCRGWADKRKNIPLAVRLLAAQSEILLYKKHPSPYILWAVWKYILVRFFRL